MQVALESTSGHDSSATEDSPDISGIALGSEVYPKGKLTDDGEALEWKAFKRGSQRNEIDQ